MAVANTKSTAITNADATPRTPNNAILENGPVCRSVATVEVAAADDNDSVYRLFRVHSSWRIDAIEIACDAITGGTAFDIGLYDVADGAVVTSQQTRFASAVDLSSALTRVDKTYEATATDISKVEKRLWDFMGLAADTNKFYDLAMTATTVGTGAGTITAWLTYVR